jgi:hypothetical protein
MFFWILLWFGQVFLQMWKHIEYYNIHHDYVDGFDDDNLSTEDAFDATDDDFDTDLEEEDEEDPDGEKDKDDADGEKDDADGEKDDADGEKDDADGEKDDEEDENDNVYEVKDLLTEEEFVREFVQIIKRNIDDGDFVYDDSWLYQSLKREIN